MGAGRWGGGGGNQKEYGTEKSHDESRGHLSGGSLKEGLMVTRMCWWSK